MFALAGLLAAAGAVLAAAHDDYAPWASLLNYGILGLLALGLLTDRVVSRGTHNECQAERDRLRAELGALRLRIEEQVVPALIRSTDVLARYVSREERR